MGFRGNAFLAIWNDIAPEAEAGYNEWHTAEHIPERVGPAGFLVARRFVNWDLTTNRYFTLYEGAELDTFSSTAYRERLNNPTEWSMKIQPYFLNFIRSACVTIRSQGLGVGGGFATIRLLVDSEETFLAEGQPIIDGIRTLHGITGVHVGAARPEVTNIKTRESEIRERTGEELFDAIVLMEGIGRREVEHALQPVADALRGLGSVTQAVGSAYELAYRLENRDLTDGGAS